MNLQKYIGNLLIRKEKPWIFSVIFISVIDTRIISVPLWLKINSFATGEPKKPFSQQTFFHTSKFIISPPVSPDLVTNESLLATRWEKGIGRRRRKQRKSINFEKRVGILGSRNLKRTNNLLLPHRSCPLSPPRVRLFQRTGAASLSNCDLAGRKQGEDNRRPTTALSAGKSEIAINYVQVDPFSPSPVSIEGLVRNAEKGRRQEQKVQQLKCAYVFECVSKDSSFLGSLPSLCSLAVLSCIVYLLQPASNKLRMNFSKRWNLGIREPFEFQEFSIFQSSFTRVCDI